MFAFVLSRIDNNTLSCLVFEVQTLCRDVFYDRYSSYLDESAFLGYWNIMILLREYAEQVSVKSDEAIDRSTEPSYLW